MSGSATLGFVGIGNMGVPMAAHLLAAGYDLIVYDVRPEVAQAFVDGHGGRRADSLADLAESASIIITMLPNSDIVEQVVFGGGGGSKDRLIDALTPGKTIIDMSSSAPTRTVALGAKLADLGIELVDAPVSGGVKRAEDGTLTIMTGGRPEAVARCRPVLEAIGERIFETGALGSGHAMKALNNMVSAAGLIAAAEALLIGRRFGLEPDVMIDVLNASTGRNNSTEKKFRQFVLSRSFASGFSLDLMLKDLTTAVKLGHDTDTPAPLSSLCRELWAAADSQLGEGADHTAVVRWLEALAEVSLEALPNSDEGQASEAS
ncbi:MAG: hydroxyacid oxidoreductase [Rhodospirillaceae bacterium]|nr:hydroxyacid oxidoreductase [Rhodospirillaceae bacterium]